MIGRYQVQGIYVIWRPEGLSLWCPEHSEGATFKLGLRVSKMEPKQK